MSKFRDDDSERYLGVPGIVGIERGKISLVVFVGPGDEGMTKIINPSEREFRKECLRYGLDSDKMVEKVESGLGEGFGMLFEVEQLPRELYL